MNERIRKLVRQAGLDDPNFPIEDWDNVPLFKFAELIVKECAEVTRLNTEVDSKMYLIVKRHFGV